VLPNKRLQRTSAGDHDLGEARSRRMGLGGPAAAGHVQRERMLAKFWLNPVGLARSTGFSPRELRRIQALVAENAAAIQEAWNEHFAD